jgi:hypothetical protein
LLAKEAAMRNLVVLFAVSLATAAGPDSGFNGRWDISYPGVPNRASWMEVQGAETGRPTVKFVSIYAGDLNTANEASVRDGELIARFRFQQRQRQGEQPVPVEVVVRARLEGDKLNGATERAGSTQPPTRWIGVRAPVITDKDDGSWREGRPVRLFNGKDLTGWEPLEKDRPFNWTVQDGILKAGGGGANLVSKDRFWNFKLRVDYRLTKGSNSGIGLRGRYEIQILDDYGRPPDSHSNGSLYSRIAPAVNASRPPGEWQTYEITLIGRDLTVVLNGVKIIDKQTVEGLTAMGHDPNEGEPGPISLQGDHGPVEFRTIVLTPLTR